MSQSRVGSFVETITNTAIGYLINFFANLVILPRFGYHVTVHDTFWIGIWFTGISIARSYVLRRVFNVKRWFPQKP